MDAYTAPTEAQQAGLAALYWPPCPDCNGESARPGRPYCRTCGCDGCVRPEEPEIDCEDTSALPAVKPEVQP